MLFYSIWLVGILYITKFLDDSFNGSPKTWRYVIGGELEIEGETIWHNEKWTSGHINLNDL